MTNILDKIYTKDSKNAIDDILDIYKKNNYIVINYIYFANLVINGMIGKKSKNKDYLDALNISSLILPDGIAMQKYYKKYYNTLLHNLNGTDFIIDFLSSIDSDGYNLILYGAKKDTIKKANDYIEDRFEIKTTYYQDGYSDFDYTKLDNLDKNKMNILLLGLGTPKQEIWIKDNLEIIKKYNLVVFSQGGTFDFWSGDNKRAPKIVQNIKLEWLWRLILNPKKNFKKVYYSFYLFYFLLSKK